MLKYILVLCLFLCGCCNGESKITLKTYQTKTMFDINKATFEELDSLDGIGTTKANRIIESRKEKQYDSIYELKARRLVGDTTFKNIKEAIYVDTRINERGGYIE